MSEYSPVGAPSLARIYDCLLGGTDNHAPDRELAGEVLKVMPRAAEMALENRGFVRRAVRFLAAQRGVDQYLDIGCGLPTQCAPHLIAQTALPWARTMYVDRDPLVVTYALQKVQHADATEVLQADLHDVIGVLRGAGELLDFGRPVAVVLGAVLHFTPDAGTVVEQLLAELAPGSYLVVSHAEAGSREMAAAADLYQHRLGVGIPRTREQVRELVAGLDLVPPGLVPVEAWTPGLEDAEPQAPLPMLAAVGQVRPREGS